jgi:uncharacterized membrane protein
MNFYDIVEKFGETIDGAGVIVVIVGALIAFAGAVIGLTRHEADVYRRLRERLGRTILLGLELLAPTLAPNNSTPVRRSRIGGCALPTRGPW